MTWLEEILETDERVLWSGRAVLRPFLEPIDRVLIPGGILGLLISTSIFVDSLEDKIPIRTLSSAFGMLLMTIFLFGRFIVKLLALKRTDYAVTTKRVLIRRPFWKRKVDSKRFQELGEISKTVRKNGVGSLVFRSDSNGLEAWANTGLDIMTRGRVAGFFNIPEPNRVLDLILSYKETGVTPGGADEISRPGF